MSVNTLSNGASLYSIHILHNRPLSRTTSARRGRVRQIPGSKALAICQIEENLQMVAAMCGFESCEHIPSRAEASNDPSLGAYEQSFLFIRA